MPLLAIILIVILGLIFGVLKKNKKVIFITLGICILLRSFSIFLIFVLIPAM